jgi:hypothetical protein
LSVIIDGSASVTINSGAVLGITSGTAVASTSGTSIDFTGIPSWVKRITVMFSGVSLSSTAQFLVQLGDSGGIENTSYVSSSAQARDGLASIGGTSTAGFLIYQGSGGGNNATGIMTICLISGTTWISSHSAGNTAASSGISGGGTKTLSDTLTQIRITSTSTDTFDAGTINILYEG